MNIHLNGAAASSDIKTGLSGDAQAPIRSDFQTPRELAELGHRLAAEKSAQLHSFGALRFPEQLDSNEEALRANHSAIAEAAHKKQMITPAAEWLLDHHHTVKENFRQVRRDLPKKFFRQLPAISVNGTTQLPRTFALTWEYVAHTDSSFRPETLSAIVGGFQEVDTLAIGEIWAVPAILRYVLLENLRRLSDRVETSRRMRERANDLADRLASSEPGGDVSQSLRGYEIDTADTSFVAQLLYRLREDTNSTSKALTWLEQRLEDRLSDAEEVMISEHAKISTGNVTVGNIIRSLKRIDDFDWTIWFEDMSKVDVALREASDFAALDPRSRNHYRTTIETIARRSDMTEMAVAMLAIDKSGFHRANGAAIDRRSDVGYYLAGKGLVELKDAAGYRAPFRERFGRAYSGMGIAALVAPTLAITAAILALGAWFLMEQSTALIAVALLLATFALPALEAASALFRAIVFALAPPAFLPGFEFKSGVPRSARTLVVIPCLLTDRDTVAALVRNLEVHYLANPDPEIFFALLSDLADSKTEQTKGGAEIIAFAAAEIEALARKYAAVGPRRFFLLHRRPLYNPSEGVWMGWERKRGKLQELNMLLRGDIDTTFGAPDHVPAGVQYVLTLDSDTRLPRDSARKLIGKLAHPLNAPTIDPVTRRVTEGYAILQPRITPSLTTGDEASIFQRIFSRDRGLDPYVFAVSDVYQDLFGEGSFTGKGLYHVDAFHTALEGRIAENTILSHDLLEGAFGRSALVTDVVFIEDFPVQYSVEASRQHRWVRGDWQLLPYILGSAPGTPPLSRFKMIDNLRRSATPAIWIISSLASWSLLAPGGAVLWQLGLIIAFYVGPIVSLFAGIVPRQVGVTPEIHARTLLDDLTDILAQIGLHIAFMAHNAALMADAIIRTLCRLYYSRKQLIEWKTTLEISSSASRNLADFYRLMWASPAIGLVCMGLVFVVNPVNAAIAVMFGLIWMAAPALAWWISQTLETEDRLKVSDDDVATLRALARRTWRFFEVFVTRENNFLPPDNFQEEPIPVVAYRTSPTNIGLYLLSTITARDMGWISFADCIQRLEETLDTVEKMEKFKGHLYNWYDTRDLAVLHPRYVSAVDSGNLAGHLIVVSSTLKEWSEALTVHLIGDVRGIIDTARVVRETLDTIPDARRTIRPLRRRLEERLAGFDATLQSRLHEPQLASVRSISLSIVASDVQACAGDLDHEIAGESSGLLVEWADRLHANCEAHFADALFDRSRYRDLQARLTSLGERARSLAFKMDFGFLFNQERRLLSIGYNGVDQMLDESCYDLLASEARLTSLFAIAKGDVPSEHWFRLGRPVSIVRGQACLVSWSGSMFEYLMPPLVMHERQGGILNQSDNLSIDRQIAYGKSLGLPWGVSESAFNARDRELNYQYHNFGVPGLGLKRELGSNVVISPYASALASQFKPRDGVANLGRLASIGALGVYGYYDAVDFTEARLPEGQSSAVVRNYMAHHQGMSIAAIGNVVLNGRLRDRFHSDPVIEAAELLLQERAPREIVPVRTPDESEPVKDVVTELASGVKYRVIDNPLSAKRSVAVISNGHYSLMVTATGSGYSRWNGLDVTRWRADPTVDDWGSYIFLRDVGSGDWWSATPAPRAFPGETASTVFSDEKAEFHKTAGMIESKLECLVATEIDAEGRRLTIVNNGAYERLIEVTSYGELVLSAADSDAAHPVFSKMFVKTEIGDSGDVIYASRNKRAIDEPDMHVAHLVGGSSARGSVEAETDRRAFIGRGRDLATAQAFDPHAKLEGHDGFTLDPIFALRRTVRLKPGKKASVVFWTFVAPSRPELETRVARYRHAENFDNEAALSWTRSQVQFRHLDSSKSEALLFQRIASFLIYPDTRLRQVQTPGNVVKATQAALWPLGISGDFPIFALRIDNEADLPIVQKSFRMQEYLRSRGVIADLVIINERTASYAQDMQHAIDFMCENARRRGLSSGPAQHIFSVRKDLMDERAYDALISAGRIVLHTRNGAISEQIERLERLSGSEADTASHMSRWRKSRVASNSVGKTAVSGEDLSFWNGYGGFDPEGRDYVIRLNGGASTPQPWINVISNGAFGFHIAAEGAGFTWSANSRDYQLTPWSNDAVVNRPSEAFYIRDLKSDKIFSPFAAIGRNPQDIHEVRHGPGRSRFKVGADGLDIVMTQIVAESDPAKLMQLSITNHGGHARSLRVYAYAEWVLGNNRARTAPYIKTWHEEGLNALLAQNPFSVESSSRTSFLAASRALHSFTSARAEFLGDDSNSFAPSAVSRRVTLSNTLETAGDPCAALAVDLIVQPGETVDTLFVLGDVENEAMAAPLIERLIGAGFAAEQDKTNRQWDGFLDALQVSTPDEAFDRMVNTWLPYQNLACRIRARSAFYQASGAFGFRDQLQDTLALMLQDPSLARAQILNAASRQFPEGDVQHWWLPRTGAGVRTLISDDVVWLAYATAHYVAVTGDASVLDEDLAFLQGPLLGEKHESFFQPDISEDRSNLYDHCARALDLAITRTGAHGLPLILGGDWNDGMNRVGVAGEGESVWLGWFLIKALEAFSRIAEARGDQAHADAWRTHRSALKAAIEADGWDGEWYRRGYFDDGSPLGSAESDECRIDSIAQSWSILSGGADPDRAAQAMDSISNRLIDPEAGLIRLFAPPFEHSDKDPGYIKSYPPGVRENGGQYTHAAIWVAYALAEMGRSDEAYRVFSMLNPINHALTRELADVYRVEPYVVAADVYGVGDKTGRGGWTWYTGSAGWLYRTAVEAILGIRREGDRLRISPSLPAAWPGFAARLVQEGAVYEIVVSRDETTIVVHVNGQLAENGVWVV
ncbi:cyclic beta-1,2-glucan synthetase [Rhizobium sp. SG_E_25_P2]|uniref:GH36-type glycosyl hydrolase domain-containing protein n=1 Tax=Rhizobium sp. SG_E_25_P2 TaxID=2879942 RepID=UPI002475232A|nr:glucoamylase family protein [Rhizobium sp. SG_E_25_P2]MDH6265836.1 cyclic beta-1,2-glucan synthetase [Rhizobium sp. SG_E_25_P2]